MLQRSSSLRFKKVLQSVLAAAALGLTAGAANAQYGYALPRLGGPLVVADYSGYGYNGGYGYSSPYTGSAFGYNAYSNGSTTMGLNNLPRNIAFDGTGTFGFGVAANNTAAGANQLINDPLLGYQQPRQIVVPTASGYVDANGNPVSLANVISGVNNGSVFVNNTGLTGNTSLNDASTAGVSTAAGVNNPVVITPSSIGMNSGFINPNALIGQPSSTSATWLGSNTANLNAAALVNGGFPAAFSYSTQAITPGMIQVRNGAINPNAMIGQPSSTSATWLASQVGVPGGRIISQPNRLIGQPNSPSAAWLGRSGGFGIQSSLPRAVRAR